MRYNASDGILRVATGDWHSLGHREIDPVSPNFRDTYPPHCMADEIGKLKSTLRTIANAPRWRDNDGCADLSAERYAEIADKEQFLLTVTENGYGKRTSSHEYRITGRGGKGHEVMKRGQLVRAIPAAPEAPPPFDSSKG